MLLAGPAWDISRYAGYEIDARTAAARAFSFFPPTADYPANAPADIGYGAVIVPAPPSNTQPSSNLSTYRRSARISQY